MKPFMDEDFLLQNETAKALYHDHAEDLPIIDYHNHLSCREIYEDKNYESITEVWLGGDHYKWRAMRGNGIPEEKITGRDTDPYERFKSWAATVPQLSGNPLYHWTHLELQRYFGISEPLSEKNAKEVYETANRMLAKDDFRVRNLLLGMKTEVLCTTDDPADDLEYHRKLKEEEKRFSVLPTFRPEKAMGIGKEDYVSCIKRLEEAAGVEIESADDLLKALVIRLDYFCEAGCRITDHSLEGGIYQPVTREEANGILKKALSGQRVLPDEEVKFKGYLLCALAKEYHERGLVMQLHIGAMRNNSQRMFKRLGPDAGFDSQDDFGYARELSALLNEIDRGEALPKTVLYCLNPKDNEMLASLMGNYQDGSCPGKIQLGPAWWFCDHKSGMERQMQTLMEYGVFSRFIGMLTDSRSFLSFPRHEYFRRILCNLVGEKVEAGEYPCDMDFLGQMVEDVCYYNAKEYLSL